MVVVMAGVSVDGVVVVVAGVSVDGLVVVIAGVSVDGVVVVMYGSVSRRVVRDDVTGSRWAGRWWCCQLEHLWAVSR